MESFTNPHHLEYSLVFAITIVLELALLNQYSSQILKLGQSISISIENVRRKEEKPLVGIVGTGVVCVLLVDVGTQTKTAISSLQAFHYEHLGSFLKGGTLISDGGCLYRFILYCWRWAYFSIMF